MAGVVMLYRFPAPDDLVGERLKAELVAAGLPDPDGRTPLLVTLYLFENEVEVSVPSDQDFSDIIAKTIDAHLGNQHPDELALQDFAAKIEAFRQRILAGEKLDVGDLAFYVAVAVQ